MTKELCKKYQFTNYDAVMIAEGVQEVETEEEYLAAWQFISMHNLHLGLQGFFGRTVQALRDGGEIEI